MNTLYTKGQLSLVQDKGVYTYRTVEFVFTGDLELEVSGEDE